MYETIAIDKELYTRLTQRVGEEDVKRFIEDALWRLVLAAEDDELSDEGIEAGYREKAADEEAEREAYEWCEALIGETLP